MIGAMGNLITPARVMIHLEQDVNLTTITFTVHPFAIKLITLTHGKTEAIG